MRAAVLGTLLLGAAALPADAHEIPRSVVVRTLVRVEAERVRVLVRVPLAAMRDFDFPSRGNGYFHFTAADTALRDAARQWIANELEILENGRRVAPGTLIAARAALPADRSFERYDAALATVLSPRLPDTVDVPWRQLWLDVLLEYPIDAATSTFAMRPRFERLGIETTTVLVVASSDGNQRVLTFVGDAGLVHLEPRWYQAASRFLAMGFTHILDGVDHLLFLLCLVVPFRRFRPLVVIVTAFTAGHSITLAAAALGLTPTALWFPPLVETLIALSIFWMALENIVRPRFSRRWAGAFAFGLVHGLGFSFALRESLQLGGAHLAMSLLSFNVGVELGQVAALAVGVPVVALAFKHLVAERLGVIILSTIAAHTAWHWTAERGANFLAHDLTWPALDAAAAASMIRLVMVLIVVGAAVWLAGPRLTRWTAVRRAEETG